MHWNRGYQFVAGSPYSAIVSQKRPHSGQTLTWIYMNKNSATQALYAHKVNHALGYSPIDADAQLNDYPLPPGASLKLFSHDLTKGWESARRTLEGVKTSNEESPWILTGCSLGRTPLISVCLQWQSPVDSFRSSRTLTALAFSKGNSFAITHFGGTFREENNLNQ